MIFSTQRSASKESLMSSVSELDIFLLFCKHFEAIGRRFKSPIVVSNKPDDGIGAAYILHKNGILKFYDHRIGKAYGALDLAMLMTGLNFRNVIAYLCDEFGVLNAKSVPIAQSKVLVNRDVFYENHKDFNIDVRYENWSKQSLQFWVDHGWLPYMLDKALIRPIERFWMSNSSEYRIEYNRPLIGPISFTYDFVEINGIFRRKIYNPYAEKRSLKWKNNTNKSIIQALNTIDYHAETLYITSSLKDCGPYWTILNKPCAIAPNSESTLMSVSQIRAIKQMSDKQILWFDNDDVGRMNAMRQSKLYGFECKWNPIGSPKDQSDYVNQRGLKEFRKLIL